MARKKRTAVKKQLESPDSPFFRLPGELRNRIYELVFAYDGEPVNVEDAFLPSGGLCSKARPPSSALMRSCRKLYHESKDYFPVAYRNYWRKDFVIDLRKIDALREYIESVPTAWIDTYIITLDTSHDYDSTRVVISRDGGQWHAKVRSGFPSSLARAILRHTLA